MNDETAERKTFCPIFVQMCWICEKVDREDETVYEI